MINGKQLTTNYLGVSVCTPQVSTVCHLLNQQLYQQYIVAAVLSATNALSVSQIFSV